MFQVFLLVREKDVLEMFESLAQTGQRVGQGAAFVVYFLF